MAILLFGYEGDPDAEAVLRYCTAWCAARIPAVGDPRAFGKATCIAAYQDGASEPMAVTLFHNYDQRSRCMEISCAADDVRWAMPGTIRAMLSYPFEQLGCGVVVCRVPQRSTRTKKFLSGIGFRATGSIPHGFGTDNCILYCMTRRQAARWLDQGQEAERAQAA